MPEPQPRYLLLPCAGVPPARRDHVFRVIDCGGAADVQMGYMSADDAAMRFGADQLSIFMSHGFCPDCLARYPEWSASAPVDAGSPDTIHRLSVVDLCRRPRTFAALRRHLPGRVLDLPVDLRILIRAGYISLRDTPTYARYVATPRGVAACRATACAASVPGRRATLKQSHG